MLIYCSAVLRVGVGGVGKGWGVVVVRVGGFLGEE